VDPYPYPNPTFQIVSDPDPVLDPTFQSWLDPERLPSDPYTYPDPAKSFVPGSKTLASGSELLHNMLSISFRLWDVQAMSYP
jgi:hypothetical protein